MRRAGVTGGGGDVETGDEKDAAVLVAQKDPRVLSSHARHGSPSHWWMPPKRRCRPGPSVLFFVSSTFSAKEQRFDERRKTA